MTNTSRANALKVVFKAIRRDRSRYKGDRVLLCLPTSPQIRPSEK
ncbi:hypothetical protein [Nostoc punctiforme]|nr:hypothetical protein [Nostoc punctiforme]